jgi:D-glycero-D-manno-heptose 1,7-bisphosphate phosphatase
MRKAVFLDRDGVINRKPPEHDYVKQWEELELLPTAAAAIKKLKEAGYFVFVITNQRGVARKLMTAEMVEEIHERLNVRLREAGAEIDAFYWCGHDYYHECNCRKPKPGLVHQAAREWGVDLADSWMVGDSEVDMECGLASGVRTVKMETDASLLEVVETVLMRYNGPVLK